VSDLPRGTVTLLFTDIEGSTQLQHRLGERYQEVVGEHRRLVESAFTNRGQVSDVARLKVRDRQSSVCRRLHRARQSLRSRHEQAPRQVAEALG